MGVIGRAARYVGKVTGTGTALPVAYHGGDAVGHVAGQVAQGMVDNFIPALPSMGVAGAGAAMLAYAAKNPEMIQQIAHGATRVGNQVADTLDNYVEKSVILNGIDTASRATYSTAQKATMPLRTNDAGEVMSWTETLARGAGETVVQAGKDAGAGARWLWQNRDSRKVKYGAAAGFIGLAPIAYEGGQNEAKRAHKLQQVASNMSLSADAGGTYLRPIANPQVEDFGATGDLVFALHNLRNGG